MVINMNIVELFILAIGLSMDAFAVSICKGLSLSKIKVKHMITAGIWFGGFQAIMPMISYHLGSLFYDIVSKWTHYIGFILLILIGINMIKEAREENEHLDDDMCMRTMFLLAVATSIDALAVGVTFAMLKVNIILAMIVIGMTTFLFSAVGIRLGNLFGEKYNKKAELLGGIILILIALKILVQGLHLI